MGQALQGATLTRDELATEVGRRTPSTEMGDRLRESWGALLKPAAFRGQLCFAPGAGQKVRFTQPASWLGAWSDHDPEDALIEVARRFLAAHGPASREDLARWWGVTPAQGGRMIAALGDEAVRVAVEGAEAWMLAAHVAEAADSWPQSSVSLLPAFDQYMVGATKSGSPSRAPTGVRPTERGTCDFCSISGSDRVLVIV